MSIYDNKGSQYGNLLSMDFDVLQYINHNFK